MHGAGASRRRRIALATVGGTLALAGGAAAAIASQLPRQVSTNWAGYVATSTAASRAYARRFESVEASWVQPSATCVAGQRSFAAFWVGLGGYATHSRALEQAGSEADCSSGGRVYYYAWYELVPAGPRTIRIRIEPGDRVTARVAVSGERVTVTLADARSGARFVKHVTMRSPAPDVSAADWIAEAPSSCDAANNCVPLSLTDFGSVGFEDARATSVGIYGRHSGTINDSAWTYGAISLTAPAGRAGVRLAAAALATPGPLSSSGNSFSVSFGASGPTGPTGTTGATGSTGSTGATVGETKAS